jgi:hypothetical protein
MLMIRYLIYTPLKKFPKMADLLADLAYGNGSAFAEYKQDFHKQTCPLFGPRGGRHDCRGGIQNSNSCQPLDDRATTQAILCSDAVDVSNKTKGDFREIVKTLYGQSKWLGVFWSTIPMPCMHWKVRPKWSIMGGKAPLPKFVNLKLT